MGAVTKAITKFISKGVKKADYASKAAKMKPREKAKSTAKVIMPQKKKDKLLKAGMSEGHKFRQRKHKELIKLKRQLANPTQQRTGRSKPLENKIIKLQEEIDKSYKVK